VKASRVPARHCQDKKVTVAIPKISRRALPGFYLGSISHSECNDDEDPKMKIHSWSIFFVIALIGIGRVVQAHFGVNSAWHRQNVQNARRHVARQETISQSTNVVQEVDAISEIKNYAAQMMGCPSVQSPGYMIAGVQGQMVLFADSLGIADLQHNTPADAQTQWAIGSVTKSFTAILIGRLVDQGLLQWTTIVQTVLPNFRLYDNIASSVTIGDLLSMQSGISRNDVVWAAGNAGNGTQLTNTFHVLQPACTLRTTFFYNNFGYVFLGQLVELLTNKSWEQNVIDTIFTPLNMTHSATTTAASIASGHYAYPHLMDIATNLPVNYQPRNLNALTVDQVAAAGSICLSAADGAQYLKALLTDNLAGQLSTATTAFLHNAGVMSLYNHDASGTTLIDFNNDPNDPLPFILTQYGNGYLHGTYRGQAMFIHDGGTLGQSTWITIFPADDLAFLFVSNMDALSGVDPSQYMWDWAFYARDLITHQQHITSAPTVNTSSVCSRVYTVPGFVDDSWNVGYTDNYTDAEINAWVGTYRNAFWGDVVIARASHQRVYATYGNFAGYFYSQDGFLNWITVPGYYQIVGFAPTFMTNALGHVTAATFGMDYVDPVFVKQ